MTTTIAITVTFPVSGKAMSTIEGSEIYYDPVKYDGGSDGARAAYAALHHAPGRRSGRGWTYTVTTTIEGAVCIEHYCRVVGETFAFETETDLRAEGRALLTVADRIMNELAALS